MGFSITVDGVEELAKALEKAPEKAAGIAAEALYEGAGVVADSVSRAIDGIATEPFRYAWGGKKRKPSPEEKALVASAKHGVAKFRKNGLSVQTSVGFQNAGYGEVNGKTKPIPLVANSINAGTSFMVKQPFIRKAFSTSSGEAAAKIEAELRERADKLEL